MRHFALIASSLAAVSWACAGMAASATAFPSGSTPHFRHITTEDGLGSSDVNALVQDAAGYLWIGTDNGLQRYDGYRFVNYLHDPRDQSSLGENIVTALAFTPDGNLWIGTQDAGLDLLMTGSDSFKHATHNVEDPDSLISDAVFALLEDKHGRLWIGTNDGLDRLDGAGSAFRHYHTRSQLPNGERILSLYQDTDGRIWVGSDHGTFYYDERQDALLRYTPSQGASAVLAVMATAPVETFCRSNDGRLWIGTEHGLAVLGRDGAVQAFYTAHPGMPDALQSDHVRGILEDVDGEMWIVALHGGLSRFDKQSGRFSTYMHDPTDPGSVSDDDMRHLYRDRTGILWLATYNGGINIYDPRTRAFGYYRSQPGRGGLASNLVWTAYKDPDGDVWVGSLKGLTRLDKTRSRYRQYDLHDRPASAQDDKVVNSLLGDHAGNLWVGTDYGVSRYLPQKDGFEFHRLVGPQGNPYQTSVTLLFEDREQRMWIGTQQGLVQFDTASGRVVQRFLADPARTDALPNGLVTALCETKNGALWVGTAAGLGRLNAGHGSFVVYSEGQNPLRTLSSNSILSCLATPDGRLWVGTDNGLDVLDPADNSIRHYGKAEGLPDNNIYSILPDGHGALWLASDKGLTRLTLKDAGMRTYGEADGLQKGSFNSGAAFAASDGELFFGGENGLNSFYPASLPPDMPAPAVAITGFTVSGRPVNLVPGTAPVLRYRDNILGFEFTAFDYAQPSHNRFRYTLEGFDDEWHTTNGERAVTYTNLDPGTYTLSVRGSNDGINWSEQKATLSIHVLPPPWRSWWAYVGYGLALLLIGGGGFTLFARSLERRQAYVEERNRRRWAEALHQLIQSVTALEDENAIVGCLLDSLKQFISYDRALFYTERDARLALIGTRGGDAVEQLYHERWPASHATVANQLRRNPTPRLLTDEEAASLEPPGQAPRHYLAVPLLSGNSPYRLLLVGRESKAIQSQGLDIAAAMAKQVSVALDRALLIKDLERLATTDSLTRLHIRRSFLERAEAEFDRSRRYQRMLTMLMLDVDHFKRVNDTHGHETGDQVLRVLADTCRSTLRLQDVVGRHGGEEFIALLPETSLEVAQEVAERLRRNVEGLTVNSSQGKVKVTVSIGIATLTPTTRDIDALINAADKALYEAKQKGRNRVVVSS